VFKADVADGTSPIVYGYGDTLGVYFSQAPVFQPGGFGGGFRAMMSFMDGGRTGRVSGRGTATDPDIPQGRPRDLGQKTIEEWQKAEKEKKEKAAGGQAAGAPEQPAEEMPFGHSCRQPPGQKRSSSSRGTPRTS